MALKTIYDKQDDIPEQFQELFTERAGKWELTGIAGVKTQTDVDRLTEGLRKEREDHKIAKDKLTVWGDMDHPQIIKDLDELKEARVRLEQGEGKIDEEKISAIVIARVATETAPVKRDLEKALADIVEKDVLITDFRSNETTRTVTDAVRSAAVVSKIIDTAMDDVIMLGERMFEITEDGKVLTKDKVGVTPGIEPDIWLSEMKERRPHWWPVSTGGGAGGSGSGAGFSDNPFSNEHWNLTKQGAAVTEDRGRAERMAKAAGTIIGGQRPVPRQKQAPI